MDCKTLLATGWLDLDAATWAFSSRALDGFTSCESPEATLAMAALAALCMFLDGENPSTICRRFVCSNCSTPLPGLIGSEWLAAVHELPARALVGVPYLHFPCQIEGLGPRTFSPWGQIRGCFLACGSQDIVGFVYFAFLKTWYELV